MDADTGVVRLRDELHKDADTEYQVDVRAFDMGEPSLSSVATLPVYVRHLFADANGEENSEDDDSVSNRAIDDGNAAMSSFSSSTDPDGSASGLAFSDDSYTASVLETLSVNGTVKVLQVINAHKTSRKGSSASSPSSSAFGCAISADSGSDEDGDSGANQTSAALFRVYAVDHACAVALLRPLDYETRTSLTLRIHLTSGKYLVNVHRSVAILHVLVLDANDNAPEFVLQPRPGGRANTFYAVVPADADVETGVMQVSFFDFVKKHMRQYKLMFESLSLRPSGTCNRS